MGTRDDAMQAQIERLGRLRVLIVGAAREGLALTRFFARIGATTTLSDIKPASAFGDHAAALKEMGVDVSLGQAMPPMEDIDVLFVSPGVPPTAPVVNEARRLGLPISSEPRLTTQLCQAPILGITGSSGKSTTTSLLGEMQRASGRDAWVGGNLGAPLIENILDAPTPDIAVMELSSFQLELFGPEYQGRGTERLRPDRSRAVSLDGWSPRVAILTNITPNHLDRHPSMSAYIKAKTQILRHQGDDDWAVLNADDARSQALRDTVRGELLTFSLVSAQDQGAFFSGETLYLRDGSRERTICRRSDVRLRGLHNVANILAAACGAMASGLTLEPIVQAATTFQGVPHRLEEVRRWRGALYVNDSIATSPERAMAALRAFDEPVILLAGGRDKHLPWDAWADLALDRSRAIIAFGEAVPIIESALAKAAESRGVPLGGLLSIDSTLEAAVLRSAALAREGDVVLLSPGGTSFDAYRDFEARGQHFRELVRALGEV